MQSKKDMIKFVVSRTISIIFAMLCLVVPAKLFLWMGMPKLYVMTFGIILSIDFALIISGVRKHGLWWWKKD